MEKKKKSPRRLKFNTVQTVVIGFFGVILGGGILLSLPICNQKPIEFIDALFTSVSSVCVTGLVTIVPAEQFTLLGKTILLLLIQVGGLGVIACMSAFFLLLGKKINMKGRITIKIFLWSEVLALSLSKSTAFPAIIQFSDDISNPPTEAPVEL